MATLMTDKKNLEVKKTPEEFAERYKQLCDELGYRVVVSPVWIARDDGTFSMQLQYTVGELPKEATKQ